MPVHCHATPKALCLTSHSVTKLCKAVFIISRSAQLSGSAQQQPSWAVSTHPTQPTCCSKARLAQASRPLSCVWHRAMLRPPEFHLGLPNLYTSALCKPTTNPHARAPAPHNPFGPRPWQPNTAGAKSETRCCRHRCPAHRPPFNTYTRCCLATKPTIRPYPGIDQTSTHPPCCTHRMENSHKASQRLSIKHQATHHGTVSKLGSTLKHHRHAVATFIAILMLPS